MLSFKSQPMQNEIKIPKTIIQTWKTNKIPDKYKILVDSIKKK